MDDFEDYFVPGTQQLDYNTTTETSVSLQKTLYLLINNEKKLLKLGENKIGRSNDSDICLTSDTVSYYHAAIECDANDFSIQDLRSTNGTKRNGKLMKPFVMYELQSETHLTFGDVEATFHAIDDDLTTTTDQEEVSVPQVEETSNVLDESISVLNTSLPEPSVTKDSSKDQSNVNGKTRLLNNDVSSAYDLETRPANKAETQNSTKRTNIYELETQNVYDSDTQKGSPLNTQRARNLFELHKGPLPYKTRNKKVYELETQCPQTSKNVYNLETQIEDTETQVAKERDEIYDLETQKGENVYNLETQKGNVYELATQIPVGNNDSATDISDSEVEKSKEKVNIYNLETQVPSRVQENSDDSKTDLSDADIGEINEKPKRLGRNERGKIDENENLEEKKEKGKQVSDEVKKETRKRKMKKKTDKSRGTKIVETSSDEEESLFRKKEKPSKSGDKNKVSSDDDSPFTIENLEPNETNSESFIGAVGRKKHFVLSSSSESDNEKPKCAQRGDVEQFVPSSSEDLEKIVQCDRPNKINVGADSKNTKSESQKDPEGDLNAKTLDSTYDVNIQNSIDEFYVSKVNASATQPGDESQFIHVVAGSQEDNSDSPFEVDPEEKVDSPFKLSDNDEDNGVNTSVLMIPESQSLLDRQLDIEGSSKNTTTYTVSEMELDSILDQTEPGRNKVINKNNEKVKSNSVEQNSSSMFSVSETEIKADFVDEDFDQDEKKEERKLEKKAKQDKDPEPYTFVTSDEDEKVKEKVDKKKELKKKEVRNQKKDKIEPSTSRAAKGRRNARKIEEKTKPKRPTKKTARRKVVSDEDSTDSDFELPESKHDTIQAELSRESHQAQADSAPIDDIFDMPTQKVSVLPSDESFIAPTQQNNNDDIFDMATQKNDELLEEQTRKGTHDVLNVQTRKASLPPSETDESFIAATQQNNDEIFDMATQKNNDIFEMQTQKVNVPPSETDDSFLAPTQKNIDDNIFEMCTQKVTAGPSHKDTSENVSDCAEDIFAVATQIVVKQTATLSSEDVVNATSRKEAIKTIQSKVKNVQKTKRNNESESSHFSDDEDKVGKNKRGKKPAARGKKVNAEQAKESISDSDSSRFSDDEIKSKKDEIKEKTVELSARGNRRNAKPTAKESKNVGENDSLRLSDDEIKPKKENKKGKVVEKETVKKNRRNPKTTVKQTVVDSDSSRFSDDEIKPKKENKKGKVVEKETAKKNRRNPKTTVKQTVDDSDSSRFSDDEKIELNDEIKPKKDKKGKAVEKETAKNNRRNPKTTVKQTVGDSDSSSFSDDDKTKKGVKKGPLENGSVKSNQRSVKITKRNTSIDSSSDDLQVERKIPVRGRNGTKESQDKECMKNVQVVLSRFENSETKGEPKAEDKPKRGRPITTPVKRETTRARKKNPKYEDAASEENKSEEKKVKLTRSMIEENQEFEDVINENNFNVANLNEVPEEKPLRGRGRKKDTKAIVDSVDSATRTTIETTPMKTVTSVDVNRGDLEKPSSQKKNSIAETPKPKTTRGWKAKSATKPSPENLEPSETPKKSGNKETKVQQSEALSCIEGTTAARNRPGKRGKNVKKEDVKESLAQKKTKKNKDEEELESNESQTSASSTRGISRTKAADKPSPKEKETPLKLTVTKADKVPSKRKETPSQEVMKAPSTPKKRRGAADVTEVRTSPRQGGRVRSSSSSSESSNSTVSSERRMKLSISSTRTAEMKISFTMIDNPHKYNKLLTQLSASVTDDPLTSDVLVTMKIARSLKFLMFLAMGKPIVSIKWLTDSEKSMKFMPHAKYILQDKDAEKLYGFCLSKSIATARHTKLLENYNVFVTSSVRPTPNDMKSIVECAGGNFIAREPSSWAPYSIVVTDPADSKQLKTLLTIPGTKPSVVNKEFIISGILQQKLDFVKHQMKV